MTTGKATLAVMKAIAKPTDATFRASEGECNFRRALIESVPREAVVDLIAAHLYRVCTSKTHRLDWQYTTPRLWYAAPFR